MQQSNATISQALNQALSQSMQNPAALALASSLQQLGLPPGTVALQGPNGSIIWAAPQQSLQQIQQLQQQQQQQQQAQQNVNQSNLNSLSQALSQQTPVLNPSSVMPMTVNSQSLGQPAINQSINQLRQTALQLQQSRNLQSLLQQAVNVQSLNQTVNPHTLSQALAQTLSQQLGQSLVQIPSTSQQQHIDPSAVQSTSPTSALVQLQTSLLQAAQAGNPQALLQLQSLQQLLVQQPNLTINQTINSSVTGAPLNLASLNGHHALTSPSTQPASSTLSHQAVQALGMQSGSNSQLPTSSAMQTTSPSPSQRLLPLPPFQLNGNVLNGGGRSSPDSDQPPNHANNPVVGHDAGIKQSDSSAFKPRKRDRESNKAFKQEVRDVIRQNQASISPNEASTDSNPVNSSESSRSTNLSNSDSSGSRSNKSNSSDASSDNEADDEEDARDDQQSRRKKHQTHASGTSNTSPTHTDSAAAAPTVSHPQATRPLSYTSNPQLLSHSVTQPLLTHPMFFSDSTLLSSDGISSRTLSFTQTGSSSQSSLVAPALMGTPSLSQSVNQTLHLYPSLSTEPLTPQTFGINPSVAHRSQTQQSNSQPTSQQLAQLANYISQLQQQHNQSLNIASNSPSMTDRSLLGSIPQVMNNRALTQPAGASSEMYNDESQSALSQLTNPVSSSSPQASSQAQTGPGGKKMRKKHIVTDRQRRAKIKDGMEQLRSLLSIHGSFTTDQVSIMMSSVQLIQKLKSEVAVLKNHTAQIKTELDRYKATFGPIPTAASKPASTSPSTVASTSESGGSEGNTANTSSGDDSMGPAAGTSASPSPLSALSTLVALGLDSAALHSLNLESLNSLALLSALTESQTAHDKGKASPLQGSMAALSMSRDGAVHHNHPRSGSETSENTPSPMLADQSSPDEADSPDSTPDPVRMSLSNPNLSSSESTSAAMQT